MPPRPIFHKEIGRDLAEIREKKKGWSQSQTVDIARRKSLPLGMGALRFLEEGKTKHPDAEILKTLCVLYGLSFRELAARFVKANYGSDLANYGSDLIGHGRDQDSGLPNNGGGPIDVSVAARIFDLEQRIEKYEETAREVHQVADRLFEIAVSLEKHHKVASGKPGRRGRHRKAG